ncbi:MAG: hypothetical protein GY835_07830 [bacterium]|nr:hypothetical protein [bacterium]
MLVSRRDVACLMIMAIVLLAVCLPGCGGGSSPTGTDQGDDDEVPVDGNVTLPVGMVFDSGSVALTLGGDPLTLGADGAYSATLRDGSRQLAILAGTSGDPMLMSWLHGDHTNIDVRSTAAALVYFGLGVWALPPAAADPICALLADPTLDLSLLESAISAQLIANPTGFTVENTVIKTALIQTLSVFYDKRDGAEADDRGLLIEPADEQSGIACLNQGGINKFSLRNSYRRRAIAFIKKISWFDDGGTEHFLPTSPPQKFEIPPVAGFAGVIGTIGSAVTGGIAYTPVTMPAVQLENHPGANYTKYWVITGGLGIVDPAMSIYLNDDEQHDVNWVCLKGIVWDLFIPLLMNVLATVNELGHLDAMLGAEDEVGAALLEVMTYMYTNIPQIYQYAADGHYELALTECYNGISVTGGFRTIVYDLLRTCLENLGVAAGDIAPALDKATRFLAIVGWIDIVGNYLDSCVVFAHIAASSSVDEWDVRVTDPAITLNTSQSSIHVCDRVDSLTVNIVDDTGTGLPDGTAYVYRWSCGGVAGTLMNPVHPADDSNSFETSSSKTLYRADAGAAGDELITVRVLTRQGSNLTYIGSDSTTVAVRQRVVTVTPEATSLAPEDEETFEISLTPQFSVAVTDSVYFAWSNTAVVGDLYSADDDLAPFTTQATAVSYEAGEEVGDDTLTLEAYRVFEDGYEATFATISIPIQVEDFGIILIAHPDTVAPDGLAFADIMATIRLWAPGDTDEPTGDPVTGRTVTFSTDLGELNGDNPAVTNTGGNALIAISSGESGTATVVAECEGVERTVAVTFTRQVHLTPATLHIASGNTRTLTTSVNPDFDAGADVLYRWTCDEEYGTLTGPDGESPPFDSALPAASYTADDEAGDEIVTVEVLYAATPGDYRSVGTDVSEIEVGGVGMILNAYPLRIFADGVMEGTVEAILRYWNEDDLDVPTGDPVTGEMVSLTATLGSIAGDNPVLTDAEGLATFRISSSTTGTAQLTVEHELVSETAVVNFVPPGSGILLVRISEEYLGIYVAWAEVPGATAYTMTWDAGGAPSSGPGGICYPGPLTMNTGAVQTAGDEWAHPDHELVGYKCFHHWTISGGVGTDFGDWPSRVYASYAHYQFTVSPHFR